MEIIEHDKKKVVVSLTPIELEILRQASIRESRVRDKKWSALKPEYPEEVVYHAEFKDTATRLKAKFSKVAKKYRDWGILK